MKKTLRWPEYDPMVFDKEDLKRIFSDVAKAQAPVLQAYLDACDVRRAEKGEARVSQKDRNAFGEQQVSALGSHVSLSISFALLNEIDAGDRDAADPAIVDKAYDEALQAHKDHYGGQKNSEIYLSNAFYRAQLDLMESVSLAIIGRMKQHVHDRLSAPAPNPT